MSFHSDGIIAFNKGEYEKAKLLFLQAIKENPATIASYLWLGKAHFFCDEAIEAIAPLNKYIELAKKNDDESENLCYAYDLLGQCYEAAADDQKASECYTASIKTKSSQASAWHNMALLFMKWAKNHIQECNKILKELENCFDGKKMLLITSFHEHKSYCNQRLTQAKKYLETALYYSTQRPMILNSLAGWHEQYIDFLQTADQLASEKESMGIQALISKHFESIIAVHQKVLAECLEEDSAQRNIHNENITHCYVLYADHLYQSKNFVQASNYYLEALKISPNKLNAINQVGMCFSKLEQFKQARAFFKEILEKTNDQQELADAWLNIAYTYRREHSFSEALTALHTAKLLDPVDEEEYIKKEENNLKDAMLQANFVSAPQILFAPPHPAQNTASAAVPVTIPDANETNQNAAGSFL